MKKIIILLLATLILCSCDTKKEIDISNMNDQLLSPVNFSDLNSKGFIGIQFKNYLFYAPNAENFHYKLPKKEEFKNGEYVDGEYKLTISDYTYIVSDNYWIIIHPEYSGMVSYQAFSDEFVIEYEYPEFHYVYKEKYGNDCTNIIFDWQIPSTGESAKYEINAYKDYFEVISSYDINGYKIIKEVYNNDGTIKNFVIDYFEDKYIAYPYTTFGLKETMVDNLMCLIDEEGKLYKNFLYDGEGDFIYNTLEYENEIKLLMFKKDLVKDQPISNILVSYTPQVLDENSTIGLHYKQIKDSNEYELYDLGSSNSTINIVSSKVNGYNVSQVSEGVYLFGDYSSSYALVDFPFEIYLPDTILKIGKYAFAKGTNLRKISIPDSCSEIGKAAFFGCKMLEEVKLPSNLKYLENYTFSNCENLKYIYISGNLEKIGAYVFEGCTSLKELNFGGTAKEWLELTKYYSDTLYLNTNIERIICIDEVIEIK